MSSFETFASVTQGLTGTAPKTYTASTTDTLATVVTSGYLTDQAAILNVGDILTITHDDGAGGQAVVTGYVTSPSAGVLSFTPGVQGVVNNPLGVAKRVVNNYALAGGAATQTITDASILATDIVLVMVQSTTTAGAYKIHTVPAAGTAAVTFNADPGASVVDYVVFASAYVG